MITGENLGQVASQTMEAMTVTGAVVDIPVFMYHGDCDDIVPIQESISMLNAINKRGGNAKLKICYGVNHNAWDIAYDGDELTDWLLSHKK